MLNKRNLDDQSYRSIVEAAMGRLPWICPTWTDHNSHDPGVTVLELMAWYKEMQQYQMNQVTDTLREKLLKIAGVIRRPAASASCAMTLEQDSRLRLPLSRLETPEGIPFELEEIIFAVNPRIERVCAGDVELSQMLAAGGLTFQPFAFGKQMQTNLRLGLADVGSGTLRLWFQVVPPEGVARNAFQRMDQQPRTLRWTVDGLGALEPLRDETHALSQSGYVEFAAREQWPVAEDGLCWLTVEQLDPGCEETVRLADISVRRWQLRQQETWAKSHSFCAPAGENWQILLGDAMARDSRVVAFVRSSGGWEQTLACSYLPCEEGLLVELDTREAAEDGMDNVVLVCLDALRCQDLLFDMKGLPGETIQLNLDGRTILTDSFTLWCNTLDRDGAVRALPWQCVDDLSAYGPRDRVFAYDPILETVRFGDGNHGAVVQKGAGAVLAADLVLSVCSGGNIPAQSGLRFVDDDQIVENTDAVGGCDRETVAEASARFLRELKQTVKCASAADYEHLARTTPGLRVGAAKALPGYDPEDPTGGSNSHVVTVVVVPASAQPKALPDTRFLAEVTARLEQLRPVCTCVRVVPPVYKEIDANIWLQARDNVTEDAVRQLVEDYLSADSAGIGGPVYPGELMARLQAMPGVLRVRKVDLRTTSSGCYQNSSGEIHMPRCAIACLRNLKLERTPVETQV